MMLSILNKLTLQKKNRYQCHHGTGKIFKGKIKFCKKKQKLFNICYNFFKKVLMYYLSNLNINFNKKN